MNWALLRGLGWGSLSSAVPPRPWTEWSSPRPALGWWEGTHTVLLQGLHFHLFSFHQFYRGVRVTPQCLCGFFSLGLEKRWDFSEQILLSPSTATLWAQAVTTWRINVLWKEGQSNTLGAALFLSLEPVRDSPHRTRKSQSSPEAQDGAGCPQSCQCHRPPPACQAITASFGAPIHKCWQCQGRIHMWQTSHAWCAAVLLMAVVEF